MASAHALEAKGFFANIKKIYHIMILLYWAAPFLLKNRQSVVRPRVLEFFRGLKTTYPGLPVGAAGMYLYSYHSYIALILLREVAL